LTEFCFRSQNKRSCNIFFFVQHLQVSRVAQHFECTFFPPKKIVRARPLVSQGCQMVYFNKPESQMWFVLERLGMENVGVFYDHLVYLRLLWYILWLMGNFVVIW
jgi:hypothetical protein